MDRREINLAEDEKIYNVTIYMWYVGKNPTDVVDDIKHYMGENFENHIESIDAEEE